VRVGPNIVAIVVIVIISAVVTVVLVSDVVGDAFVIAVCGCYD